MKYIIRYNVDHKAGLSDKRWKIYSEDGTESYLADQLEIQVPSRTEDTPVEGLGVKYSIVAEGHASVETVNNQLRITIS